MTGILAAVIFFSLCLLTTANRLFLFEVYALGFMLQLFVLQQLCSMLCPKLNVYLHIESFQRQPDREYAV